MKKIKTIGDLKDYLNDLLFDLEDYDNEEEVKMVENTYWLTNQDNFLATSWGFVDLGNPCDLEECEWCEQKFNKNDIIKKGGWCVCEQCYEYLQTQGEDFGEGEEENE